MKKIIKIESLKRILLAAFLGYIVGVIFSYINLFGSSQNAPLICTLGATIFAVVSLYNKKLDMLYKGKI